MSLRLARWLAVGAAIASMQIVAGVASADPASIEDVLSQFRERHGFPGATAAIALPDGDLLAAATGLADIEANRPMAPETPMLAASIGKTFVALIVLALEHEGVPSRGDLVSEYLGERNWCARLPNHATMTLGDLLRNGSGLPDHVHLDSFQAEMAGRMATGAAAFAPEEAIACRASQRSTTGVAGTGSLPGPMRRPRLT